MIELAPSNKSGHRRAVFLDRDGVLNRAIIRNGKPYPPASLEELEILPGVPEALALLKAAGFLLIVVTNQPDVARGAATRATVDSIHSFLQTQLSLDEFRVCFHDDQNNCDCRKPAPGLLLSAASEHGIDLGASFLVGDRWRDIEAGHRAGCSTLLLDYNYVEPITIEPSARVKSLIQAADWILHKS